MIAFLYFEGCPKVEKTLLNLKEAMRALYLPESQLKTIVVSNVEEAERVNFQGSPTILVDGVDIAMGKAPKGFSFSCRVYSRDVAPEGVLSVEYLRVRLAELALSGIFIKAPKNHAHLRMSSS